jgi:hypothetical protein
MEVCFAQTSIFVGVSGSEAQQKLESTPHSSSLPITSQPSFIKQHFEEGYGSGDTKHTTLSLHSKKRLGNTRKELIH